MLFSQGYPIGFHIQQITFEAMQELCIAHRWEAIRQEADAMRESRFRGKTYFPFVFPNGDFLRQLLARSRYLLFKPLENGFGNKRTWKRFFLPSIQTCRKLIPCHIPWGWFSPKIPIRMRRDCPWQNATARSTDPDSKVSRLLFLLWQNTMMVSWTSP